MIDDFEPTIHLCRNGQAEHAAMFCDSLAAEDVDRVARRHVSVCDGCALCLQGGPWHELRRELNVVSYDYFYS